MARAKTHAEQIAKREYIGARKKLGEGWKHVSPEIRRGLVFAGICGVIRGQDEGNDPAAVLAYFNEMVLAAEALLDAEPQKWVL